LQLLAKRLVARTSQARLLLLMSGGVYKGVPAASYYGVDKYNKKV